MSTIDKAMTDDKHRATNVDIYKRKFQGVTSNCID